MNVWVAGWPHCFYTTSNTSPGIVNGGWEAYTVYSCASINSCWRTINIQYWTLNTTWNESIVQWQCLHWICQCSEVCVPQIGKMFAKADKDGDGKLTPEEWHRVLNSSGCQTSMCVRELCFLVYKLYFGLNLGYNANFKIKVFVIINFLPFSIRLFYPCSNV
jgi:hypothetical protein